MIYPHKLYKSRCRMHIIPIAYATQYIRYTSLRRTQCYYNVITY